jgi:hypothetical protein
VLDAQVAHGRRAAQPVAERLAASGRQVIQELAERPGMGAVQPGYLLIRAGRGDDFGGHAPDSSGSPKDRRRGPGGARGLATAHLVQAVTQIITIRQCRVLKAAPHLVQQVPVLPGGPQLTEQVTDRVHAAYVQQQPGGVPGDGQDARRGPGTHGLLAQPEQPGRDNRPDGAFLRQRAVRHRQEPGPALVILGQRAGHVLHDLDSLEQAAETSTPA